MARPIKVQNPHRFILDSAKEILVSKGREELTARNLSKASGYSLGSVYVYFDNIDDLTLQINGETLDALYARLSDRQANEKKSLSKLINICHDYFDFASENQKLWNSVMNYQRTGQEKNAAAYDEKLEKLNKLFEEIISPHIGWLQNKREMASLLNAGLQGIWFVTMRNNSESTNTKEAKKMVEILVKNLFK